MSKELEALNRLASSAICDYDRPTIGIVDDELLIEKALKEKASQDSLIATIKDIIAFGRKLPEIEISDNGDIQSVLSAVARKTQRQMENKERELFRNWVLENCFPKELKALENIKKYEINVQKCYEVFYKNNWFRGCNDTHEVWDLMNEDKVISKSNLPYEVYDLLLEVLL